MPSPRENLSFADILREKMTDFPSENPVESHSVTTPPPMNFERFMTENILRTWDFQAPMKRSGYKKATPPPSHTETPKARPPEKRWPTHLLSTAAQLALSRLGLADKPEITCSQVKRAYRQMARRLHPDMNPEDNNLGFLAIKEAQDCVLSELQKLN